MSQPIFISYRRTDSAGHAGRLYDRLTQYFDSEKDIFFDVNNIDLGDHFPERINQALRAARSVLVVIGPNWVTALNNGVCMSNIDYVRIEVSVTLERIRNGEQVTVVPILMGDAEMPSREQFHQNLREEISSLSCYQAHALHGNQKNWEHQFKLLLEHVASVKGVPSPRPWSRFNKTYVNCSFNLTRYFLDLDNRLQALDASLNVCTDFSLHSNSDPRHGWHRENAIGFEILDRTPESVPQNVVVPSRAQRLARARCNETM